MNNYLTKSKFTFLGLLFLMVGCQTGEISEVMNEEFSFVFMTDIHLQPEKNATDGFRQAIDSVNKLNPDFVITGGDLIMDALGQSYKRADQLYNLYHECLKEFNMPVYNTMGNHEIFGIYMESGVEKIHPEYGEKMYENRLGKRYFSFDHKSWHFMILDGTEDTGESSYMGNVDSIQMEWIKEDLKKVNPETPVVISIHIPLVTTYMQVIYGAMSPNQENEIVINSKEVLDLFDGYNLKLVLQGHMHFLEDIYTQGTHFITVVLYLQDGGREENTVWKKDLSSFTLKTMNLPGNTLITDGRWQKSKSQFFIV